MSRDLTPRERELILRCSAPGATRESVAEELGISAHTIRHHLLAGYRKLGVQSLAQAVRVVMEKAA